ncbi:hypothetical protein N7497_012210 [Penicillium chrysogenum]|nr:hypothetical protein N7497_012210 [Penicillium chrysogenum]
MGAPDWVEFSGSVNPKNVKCIADAQELDGKSVYLTDARRVGIMLRDRRLTLRNHSALTRFIVEAISDTDFFLQSADVGNDGYVRPLDRGAFYARGSHHEAQKFQFKFTDLGMELYLAEQRPAVFDHDHDVSIGKWTEGLSFIPILIHDNLSKIWPDPSIGGANGGNSQRRGKSP